MSPSTPATPRTWLVTGASSGIGRAVAEAALRRGDRVAVTSRDADRVSDLAREHGDRALPLSLEVTDPVSVRAALDATFDAFGRLDVVVNNAGVTQAGTVEETEDAVVHEVFSTNFFAPLDVVRAALPRLRAQGHGHLLNVSSQSGHLGLMGNGIYSASKFALEGLSEALRQELEPLGIAVTIIEPGLLGTNLAPTMHRSVPMSAYAGIHKSLETAEAAMSEPVNDIGRAAQAVLVAVDAEDPPLRLALGSDCFDAVTDKLRGELEEYAAWEQVSRSVDVPREQD